jgi:hypothetical protein
LLAAEFRSSSIPDKANDPILAEWPDAGIIAKPAAPAQIIEAIARSVQ